MDSLPWSFLLLALRTLLLFRHPVTIVGKYGQTEIQLCLPFSIDWDKLLPWVFTQQDVATEDGVYRWPREREEYRFRKLFEALIDIPQQPRGLCESMGRMNEKFSSQPDEYWEQEMQQCLHFLVLEVGGFVHKSLSLDRNRFKLQYCQELTTIK
jgi:hypothetical protein